MVTSAWDTRREERTKQAPNPFGPVQLTLMPTVDEQVLDELCDRLRARVEQAVREGVTAAIQSLERSGVAGGIVVELPDDVVPDDVVDGPA